MTSREIPDVSGGQTVAVAWGNDVAQRTVQRYASQAAFPSAAGEGELAYSFADDAIFYNNGTGWVQVATGTTVTPAVYARASSNNTVSIQTPEVVVLAASASGAWAAGRPALVSASALVEWRPTQYGDMVIGLERVNGSNPGTLFTETARWTGAAPTATLRVQVAFTWVDTDVQSSTGYVMTAQGGSIQGGVGALLLGDRTLTAVQI